ncbi:MAG TPA: YqeG family HAD IIIA-type phosphatase [Firmicutes bacterium]|nr:YqeG family HAD IIIA-type phosphatase [Bacillota bacterium]
MSVFLPDIYQKSVYAINYENLKNAGIKVILFDLDNTIAPVMADQPSKKMKELFEEIKNIGIRPIILSNSNKKRVEPFKDGLFVDAACSSHKPMSGKYKKILDIYNVKPNEVAAVGDQILTDVLGANRMEITSILINPISTIDLRFTKINRFFERIILRRYEKRGVFKKGEYYE